MGGVIENKLIMSDSLHLSVVNGNLSVCSVCMILESEQHSWSQVTSEAMKCPAACVFFLLSLEFFHANTYGAGKKWL